MSSTITFPVLSNRAGDLLPLLVPLPNMATMSKRPFLLLDWLSESHWRLGLTWGEKLGPPSSIITKGLMETDSVPPSPCSLGRITWRLSRVLYRAQEIPVGFSGHGQWPAHEWPWADHLPPSASCPILYFLMTT